ncbi:MAG: cytidylyltransferase domain-containing protein [Myxococcota bacterium]
MSERFAAIVQARLGSSRLPGKVLRPLAGRAVIARVVDRLRSVAGLQGVVVAVPDTDEDRPLIDFLRRHRIDFHAFRGDPSDLLSRYIETARVFGVDGILMVDSDCPLLDPDTCARMLAALRAAPDADYVRISPASIEGGVACLRRSTFERLSREGARGAEREHATLRILEHPEAYRIVDIEPDPMFADPDDAHRFWLDTPADLRFLETVLARLERPGREVDLRDVVRLLRREPELRGINGHVKQRDPRAATRCVALLPPADGRDAELFDAIADALTERHRVGVRTLRGAGVGAEIVRLGAACVVMASDDPRCREVAEPLRGRASTLLAEPGASAAGVADRVWSALETDAAGSAPNTEGVPA